MVIKLLNQMSQLSSSNQGMMMIQLQASFCLSSIQMTLLEGPSYYPGDNGERMRAKVTRKVVEIIEKADGERVQNSAIFLLLTMENWRESSCITNLWTTWKLQPMKILRLVMIYSSSEHLLATRDLSSQQTPIGKDASSMSLLIERLGRRPMNLSQFWQQMIL